jgi:hypothetical protein
MSTVNYIISYSLEESSCLEGEIEWNCVFVRVLVWVCVCTRLCVPECNSVCVTECNSVCVYMCVCLYVCVLAWTCVCMHLWMDINSRARERWITTKSLRRDYQIRRKCWRRERESWVDRKLFSSKYCRAIPKNKLPQNIIHIVSPHNLPVGKLSNLTHTLIYRSNQGIQPARILIGYHLEDEYREDYLLCEN